jgi:zinc protease
MVLIDVDAPAEWSRDEGHALWSLGNVLERAMIDKLRLELGGIYGVNVSASLELVPYGHATFGLRIPCAPENVEKLVAAAYGEIERIRQQGPRPEEIQKEVESQRRTFEKEAKENNAWAWKLEKIYREGETFGRLANPEELVALVTAPNLQRVAAKYVDPKKAVRFTLMPEAKPAVATAKP